MSLSIVFLAMGTVIRYLSVGHIRGRDPDGRVLLQYVGVRPFVVIGIILLLVGSNITPLMGNLEFNPLFKDLNESAENTDAPANYLTDPNEVRVIPEAKQGHRDCN